MRSRPRNDGWKTKLANHSQALQWVRRSQSWPCYSVSHRVLCHRCSVLNVISAFEWVKRVTARRLRFAR
nr:MAG TPA: hypothetical protein [Caudoviricetes sp.]